MALTKVYSSLQYLYRRVPGSAPHPYHLEPQDEASSTNIRDWHSQSRILVSLSFISNLGPFLCQDQLSLIKFPMQCCPNGHPQSRLHAHHGWQPRRHLRLLGSFLAKVSRTIHHGSVPCANLMRTNSLQLNIGIIAACASFLKPLVGRLLKINSSIGYYPNSRQYNRSGHTPLDAGAAGSNAYANSKRRTGVIDRELDEFELHGKNDIRVTEQNVTTTRIQADRSHVASGDSSSEAVNTYGLSSDTNSEEIILQTPEPARGIVCRKDFIVEYSNK